jgi:hypothetical protein
VLAQQCQHGTGIGVQVCGLAEQAVAVMAVAAGVQAGEHAGGDRCECPPGTPIRVGSGPARKKTAVRNPVIFLTGRSSTGWRDHRLPT